jgi:hypothetical protein
VDKSDTSNVPAVDKAATPIPVTNRHAYNCHAVSAHPIPMTPMAIHIKEPTMYGFRPCRSTSMAAGMLHIILDAANPDTTVPY